MEDTNPYLTVDADEFIGGVINPLAPVVTKKEYWMTGPDGEPILVQKTTTKNFKRMGGKKPRMPSSDVSDMSMIDTGSKVVTSSNDIKTLVEKLDL